MKKINLLFLLLFPILAFASSTTTHYNLYKPAVGDKNWGTYVNDNFDTIDSELYSIENAYFKKSTDDLDDILSGNTNIHFTTTLKTTYDAKQDAITIGTTAQYLRGDLSLATFPTNISTFSNDAGYITGTSWGQITGTLSNQTDLKNALDAKSSTTHSHTFDGLSDVMITSPQDSQIIQYNSTSGQWENTDNAGNGITDHSELSNLDYASSGHTGFEPTLTKGNLTAGTGINISGGTNAVIGSGATITNSDRGSSAVSTHEGTYNHSLIATALQSESDPVYSAWDKSTGISITESQISDFGTYLESETDPIYSAWDKSSGISITESQISDFGSYLESESDPVFGAWDKSTGISITENQISDFGTYLTAETDPNALLNAGTDNVKDTHIDWGTGEGQVSTDDMPEGSVNKYFPGFTDLSTDYGFTDNSSDWDTAYGWGDHSSAGYLTSESDPTVDSADEIIAIINTSPATTIKHEAGGLEADVSAYSGLVYISGGSTSAKTIGIGDNNIVSINAADVANNDYAKFTTSGLAGRSYSEVLSDIGAQAADADLTTWAGITPGANVGTFLATPSSANLISALTDEVGSGKLAFNKHLRFTIVDPYTAYGKSSTICIVPAIDAAITIDKIQVTTSSASYEVAGDLKYADAFIGLANATVINDFDTSSGVRTDDTITSASVASGKCIYISFDSQPDTSMTQVTFDITYHY